MPYHLPLFTMVYGYTFCVLKVLMISYVKCMYSVHNIMNIPSFIHAVIHEYSEFLPLSGIQTKQFYSCCNVTPSQKGL